MGGTLVAARVGGTLGHPTKVTLVDAKGIRRTMLDVDADWWPGQPVWRGKVGDQRVAVTAEGARLEVRNLGYRHLPEQPLLEQLSFTVEPGRTVAVVGATAAGKSTLTSLLARLVDPDEGAVLLDGHDLRDGQSAE